MSATDKGPTTNNLPQGYEVPEVWQEPQAGTGGTFGAINRPTAGARTEKG